MRSRKRNTNIKILQSQLQNFTINEEKDNELSGRSDLLAKSATLPTVFPIKDKSIGSGIIPKELPVVEKIKKKKGIKKDELINTKRLLTQ